MKESDRQYCAIKLADTIPVRYRRTPTEIIGAAATFQKVMNIVLSGLSFEICCSYLDEILIFSRDMQEHRQHLQLIFVRLRSAGLMLHPEKCDFAKTEIIFFGYISFKNSVKIDSMKTVKIINYPRPKSVKEARSFYNLAYWFRRHCPWFSEVMIPIQELLRKDRATTFRWGQDTRERIHQNQGDSDKSTSTDATRLYKNILLMYRRLGKSDQRYPLSKKREWSIESDKLFMSNFIPVRIIQPHSP